MVERPTDPAGAGPDDPVTRRERTLEVLRREGVLLLSPPPLLPPAGRRYRTPREVLQRAIALALVAARGRGVPLERVRATMEQLQAAPWLERSEVSFLRRSRLPRKDELRAAWRAEACHCLLWALGHVERLGRYHPARQPGLALALLAKAGFDDLLARSLARSAAELLDAADEATCVHAALREARRARSPLPAGWAPDVALERHQALRWLTSSLGWDDVAGAKLR